MRKTHLKEKKLGLNRVLSGRPGHRLTRFLPILVFCLTQTDPTTRSTCRAGPSLITMCRSIFRKIDVFLN